MIKDYKIVDSSIFDLNEAIAAIKLIISNQEILLEEVRNLNSIIKSLNYSLDSVKDKVCKLENKNPMTSF